MQEMNHDDGIDCLFRIGEVAEMFECSIRTLRLYDKMGLFTPAHVDPETGYRHYTADQMPLLNTILVLKGIGFHLLEIRDLLVHGMAEELLIERLERKREALDGEMEILRFKQENVQRILAAVRAHALEEVPATDPSTRQAECSLSAPRSQEAPQSGASEQATPRMMDEAYRMSRLICLENIKLDHTLSEVLWL